MFVAGEVHFDSDGFAAVGEERGKIRRGLQLQIHRSIALRFLDHYTAEIKAGDHLRRVDSLVRRIARHIGAARGA